MHELNMETMDDIFTEDFIKKILYQNKWEIDESRFYHTITNEYIFPNNIILKITDKKCFICIQNKPVLYTYNKNFLYQAYKFVFLTTNFCASEYKNDDNLQNKLTEFIESYTFDFPKNIKIYDETIIGDEFENTNNLN